MACVLACVDLSPVTDALLAQASRLAKALGVELVVLHVAEPEPDFVGYDPGPQSVRDAVAGRLRETHRALDARVAEIEGARPLMVQGQAAEAILDHAGRLGAELVVLGSHGHGKLYDLIVGSVASDVVKKATLPIVLVPDPGR
jgi:nucleotide-binding universal stress UspA family protein